MTSLTNLELEEREERVLTGDGKMKKESNMNCKKTEHDLIS